MNCPLCSAVKENQAFGICNTCWNIGYIDPQSGAHYFQAVTYPPVPVNRYTYVMLLADQEYAARVNRV
jgi:hypothetical protein